MDQNICEDCGAPAQTRVRWFEADISGPLVGNACRADLCLPCARQARRNLCVTICQWTMEDMYPEFAHGKITCISTAQTILHFPTPFGDDYLRLCLDHAKEIRQEVACEAR